MAAYAQTRGVEFESWVALAPAFRFRLWHAGHILGSASIELASGTTRLLFSGDIGPDHKAFHPAPTAPAGLDQIGRAQVCTTVTNANHVCRPLIGTKKNTHDQ